MKYKFAAILTLMLGISLNGAGAEGADGAQAFEWSEALEVRLAYYEIPLRSLNGGDLSSR